MSHLVEERSPRTLLDSAIRLRDVLYETSRGPSELVIESRSGDSGAVSGTGFILKEVERVLLEIRRDLNVSPSSEECGSKRQLMLCIRDHTNVIGETLTGVPLSHDGDTATIVQLNSDLLKLCGSVSNKRSGGPCIIL